MYIFLFQCHLHMDPDEIMFEVFCHLVEIIRISFTEFDYIPYTLLTFARNMNESFENFIFESRLLPGTWEQKWSDIYDLYEDYRRMLCIICTYSATIKSENYIRDSGKFSIAAESSKVAEKGRLKNVDGSKITKKKNQSKNVVSSRTILKEDQLKFVQGSELLKEDRLKTIDVSEIQNEHRSTNFDIFGIMKNEDQLLGDFDEAFTRGLERDESEFSENAHLADLKVRYA